MCDQTVTTCTQTLTEQTFFKQDIWPLHDLSTRPTNQGLYPSHAVHKRTQSGKTDTKCPVCKPLSLNYQSAEATARCRRLLV